MMTGLGKAGAFMPGGMLPKTEGRHRPPQEPQGAGQGTKEEEKEVVSSGHLLTTGDCYWLLE